MQQQHMVGLLLSALQAGDQSAGTSSNGFAAWGRVDIQFDEAEYRLVVFYCVVLYDILSLVLYTSQHND